MHRSILDSLPPSAGHQDFTQVRRLVGEGRTKVVVLDDDPTGTQTVHGLDVFADWSVDSLASGLRDPRPCFYVLTNSRSMPEGEAASVIRTIASNLSAAGKRTGVEFAVISRSDSTLRGHFAAELDALRVGLGREVDGTIVIPAFFEGSRYTLGNVHYVAEGDALVPAAETEFARDRTFGYSHSDLTQWIEEKMGGRARAADVASIDLDTLRAPGGAGRVRSRLLGLPKGAFLVVNAAAYSDLEVFTHGLLRAEAAGKSYLFRTAASFVRIRAALEPRPLLTVPQICEGGPGGGMVVVGSYVRRTTLQLEMLLGLPSVDGIEVRVDRLADPAAAAAEVRRAAASTAASMGGGRHAVLFTSRALHSAIGDAGDIAAGRIVSDALVEIVRSVPIRPRFLITKGGITSNDIAIRALGMRKALILGQASPGVPVWELGAETRFPGIKLVVWPGNVGGPESLRDLVRGA